jgi:hypothetical protein
LSQILDRFYSLALCCSSYRSEVRGWLLRSAVSELFTVFYYCWSADRSQIFEKEGTLFSTSDFTLLCGLVFAVCLLGGRVSPLLQFLRRKHPGNRETKTSELERALDGVDAELSRVEKKWDDLETERYQLRLALRDPINIGNDKLLAQAQRLLVKCDAWEKHLSFIRSLLNNCGTNVQADAASTTFLPRAQTNEFKGWMQIFLLAYNYTGGEQSLALYECHRIVIAFYLFLTGYGHAMYLIRGGESSLRRICAVLFRINFLAILLSCMMDRPYASYHFAPLVSFWTLVVYFTFKPTARSKDSVRHLLQRVALSALLVAGLVHIPGVLHWILRIPGSILQSLDAEAWRLHLRTDAYIVFIGMLVAILNTQILYIRSTSLLRLNGMPCFLRKHLRALQCLAIGLALVVLPAFWNLTRRSPNKADYDWWMPYIAWLPVLSLVILRNSTSLLRSHYCAPFAWLGRMSLELYLLSQHIWMAGDGHGRLRVFSGERGSLGGMWADLAVLSPILVGLAWCVKHDTAVIAEWLLRMDISGVRV